MRRLIVTCTCGERIQVPRSALGRTGLCPSCGKTIAITNDNASAMPLPGKSSSEPAAPERPDGRPDMAAKMQFGRAVDLFFAGQFGEAYAMLSDLARRMPDDPDIEAARGACLNSLRTRPLLAVDRPAALPALSDESPQPADKEEELDHSERDIIKKVLFDKMLHGETDEIQLRAAEMALKAFGFDEVAQEEATETEPHDTGTAHPYRIFSKEHDSSGSIAL